MKTNPYFRGAASRRFSTLSIALVTLPLLTPSSAMAADGDLSRLLSGSTTIAETANPESEPLEDRSDEANPESDPVKDRSRRANPESRREVDRDDDRASPDAKEVEDSGRKASPDAERVEDTGPRANQESTPVEDPLDEKASPDAAKSEDTNKSKAGPEATKVRDKVPEKAGRDAKPVKDRNKPQANPDSREGAAANAEPDAEAKDAAADAAAAAALAADEPEPKVVPEAEQVVTQATAAVETEIEARKLKIDDEAEARGLIQDILGKESRISRAEIEREQRSGPRRATRDEAREAAPEAVRVQRREATEFLRERLRGEAQEREAPTFFRRLAVEDDSRREPDRSRTMRVQRPRYLHDGRRYIHFDSRDSIPAVLLAMAALNRVSIQPARVVEPVFFGPAGERRIIGEPPPQRYRDENAWVVSYPVNEKSMISSNDILFRQGSTQFADAHSYDTVLALAEAMKDPALAAAQFVIEGHASAEGSYEDNMALSQRRAEAIVREMVRSGIAPERLIPVGYGESEARHPADAAEPLRSQDRRVMVFRAEN